MNKHYYIQLALIFSTIIVSYVLIFWRRAEAGIKGFARYHPIAYPAILFVVIMPLCYVPLMLGFVELSYLVLAIAAAFPLWDSFRSKYNYEKYMEVMSRNTAGMKAMFIAGSSLMALYLSMEIFNSLSKGRAITLFLSLPCLVWLIFFVLYNFLSFVWKTGEYEAGQTLNKGSENVGKDSEEDQLKIKSGCQLCEREKELILEESKHWVIMLSKFPGEYGHLLIVPKFHIAELRFMTDGQLSDLGIVLKKAEKFVAEDISGGDFIGHYNGGKTSGRSIKDHFHLHLIPMKAKEFGNVVNVSRKNKNREQISLQDLTDLKMIWGINK